MKGPSRPNMYGGGALRDGCLSFGAVWNTLELRANAVLLTYLLNGEILLFIRTWPSQQKRAPGDRTRYSRRPGSLAAQRRRHSNDTAPLVTARLGSRHLPLIIKFYWGDKADRGHPCTALMHVPRLFARTGSAMICIRQGSGSGEDLQQARICDRRGSATGEDLQQDPRRSMISLLLRMYPTT